MCYIFVNVTGNSKCFRNNRYLLLSAIPIFLPDDFQTALFNANTGGDTNVFIAVILLILLLRGLVDMTLF